MKKICIFALTFAMAAVSCQKEVHQMVSHQAIDDSLIGDNVYAIGISEALENLDI